MSRKKTRNPNRDDGWSPILFVIPNLELAAWRRAAELAGVPLQDYVRAKMKC